MERAAPSVGRDSAQPGRSHDALRLTLLLAALVLLGTIGTRIEPVLGTSRGGAAEIDGAGWEGRRMMAQLLWSKTHAVLHAGAEERDALPGEEKTRAEFHGHEAKRAEEEHEGEHDDHGHEGGHVLVIPPASDDFRGILGDLEREVKPYLGRDGRMYEKDADQTVPFYRLMTWADPHFIQGYTVGATFISRAGTYPELGLELLHEGERYNPESFEIQTELGHFYLVYQKDYRAARRHLERALSLAPRGLKLTELEEEARDDTYRWLAYTYLRSGKPREAVATATQGLKLMGMDASLRNIIQHKGREW